ncbi:DUF4845 domain-containing protein [Candidatus Albibeggiatoa sp. nov. NOAA]|uniref:DUF4845 domain-containing protein n=1 Tax=Candidatus Albibeggiatoa sp. nov. NOAA TaxID=3162724 RepID=UPI0032FD33C3|nr:DUF4845 domain-containing protein [Thiotrichaceae bacterium]
MLIRLHQQRGITKYIMPLAIIGVIVWLGFQLFPIYMEQSKILSSIENLKAQPEAKKYSTIKVKKSLIRRFGVNDISKINNANYDDYIKYEKTTSGFNLVVQFQDEISIYGNLYLVSKFDQTIEFK